MADNTIKLSIGLIVKNEEEFLENCLQAIQPILVQIPSELIVVDTGSVDRTKEIARRYTEKLYEYPWNGDFAKARNFVLEKACGEWFLQLDADEILEKTDYIVTFFQEMEYQSYRDASFIIRNYISESLSNYLDYYVNRMFRVEQGRIYQGKIHECVVQLGPVKYFDEYILHYGYINGSLRKKSKKNRNLPILLEELSASPKDLRLLYHLVEEYLSGNEVTKAESVCKEILSLPESPKYENFIYQTYYMLMRIYIDKKEYEETVGLIKKFYSRTKKLSVRGLDIIYSAIYSLIQLEEYELALEYFNDLWKYKEEFDKKVLNGSAGVIGGADVMKAEMRDVLFFQYALVLEKCGKYRESYSYLRQIDSENGMMMIGQLVSLWMELITKLNQYELVYEYYQSLKEKNTKNMNLPENLMMQLWIEYPEIAEKAAYYFRQDQDIFSVVQQSLLSAKDSDGNQKDFLTQLYYKLPIKTFYGLILFIGMKCQSDLSGFIERCTYFEIDELIYYMIKWIPQLQSIIADGLVLMKGTCIKLFYFEAKILETILCKGMMPHSKTKDLMRRYIDGMNHYIEQLYIPELLNEKAHDKLPDSVLFYCYMKDAFYHYDLHNLGKYLSCLRQAVKVYPIMKTVIKKMITEVELEINEQNALKREFDEYGAKIKHIIKNLIAMNDMPSAKEAVYAYEKVNPFDPEITDLKEKIGISM